MKKTIFECTGHTLDLDYSSLVYLRDQLNDLINEYGPTAEIRMVSEPYCGDDKFATVYRYREETDAEYANRIEIECQQSDAASIRERAELQRLIQKYGTL